MLRSKTTHITTVISQCMLLWLILVGFYYGVQPESPDSVKLLIPLLTIVPACIISYLIAYFVQNIGLFIGLHIGLCILIRIIIPSPFGIIGMILVIIMTVLRIVEANIKSGFPILSPYPADVIIFLAVYIMNRYGVKNSLFNEIILYGFAAFVINYFIFTYRYRMDRYLYTQKAGYSGLSIPEINIKQNGRIIILFFLVITATLMLIIPLNGVRKLAQLLYLALVPLFLALFGDSPITPATPTVEETMDMSIVEETISYLDPIDATGSAIPQWINAVIFAVLSIVALIAITMLISGVFYSIFCFLKGYNRKQIQQDEEELYTETVQSIQSAKKKRSQKEPIDTSSPTAVVRKLYKHVIRSNRKKHQSIPNYATPTEVESLVGLQASIDRTELHQVYERARYTKEGASNNDAELMRSLSRKDFKKQSQ